MKATSNLIIWLALALLVSLGMVLGLVLLLLGELYCSPFVRRLLGREHASPPDNTTIAAAALTTEDDIEKEVPRSPENQETLGMTPQQNIVEIQKGRLRHLGNTSTMVCISNPIYDDDEYGRMGTRGDIDDNGTPFETPDSSPSRLGTEESFGDQKEEISSKVVITPPMKTWERKYANKQWRIQKNTFSRHRR
uniref:uncharacterized protein LOC122597549 n=1 Tax=Erigeron canadensis TaxID=72917 RepID=UPI001CB93BAB|nr:uncharacterized protein LOC122597549 [Erigeron canadensis]